VQTERAASLQQSARRSEQNAYVPELAGVAELADALDSKSAAMLGKRFALGLEFPETPPRFHPHAQRNAFRRRDVRQQSRSFDPENQRLRSSPKSNCASCASGSVTAQDDSYTQVTRYQVLP